MRHMRFGLSQNSGILKPGSSIIFWDSSDTFILIPLPSEASAFQRRPGCAKMGAGRLELYDRGGLDFKRITQTVQSHAAHLAQGRPLPKVPFVNCCPFQGAVIQRPQSRSIGKGHLTRQLPSSINPMFSASQSKAVFQDSAY